MEEPYQLLNAFAGVWQTEGNILPTENSPAVSVHGTDAYEWLPGEFFLLHQVDVMQGEERIQTHEIIGYDPVTRQYTMQHFDNKGNTGQMRATYANGLWTFIGERLRFTGSFNEEGNTISGTWEQMADGGLWEPFMEIRLVRNTLGYTA